MIIAYHISDLKVYPEPIEIGRFTLTNDNQVIRPPQSYFYVKELAVWENIEIQN